MMLSAIRDYLSKRGQATLADIALHVDADPDAVRGMLQQWVRKGRVEQRKVEAGCGTSCQRCSPEATELYVWRG
ncbi:MAG: sugar metabolism transcriptional regulator [gamma proteobacterium symbiont of Ctena orbiculata]|nr:FeoC-like transcriptional regulator [Candidatus Thiodiazotropha sp. (ex Lucina pensylvanica)]MBT3062035.1 FeoC-like transcriptional regulator [Candidatus Thiodiazotropha sp. (ex Lucina pensylvanica)]MBV2095122.1 FeoC-like transcriptional regulator [Candidatus Thiodiazotropha sp. (ex Codakia orbicularis)]PUB76524.1 MAG: sugar metabolism transcriptional regulator [gamma proteobacterium symbiont of Ctena orbiculata]